MTDIKCDYSITKIAKIRETDERDFIAGYEELKERAIGDFEKNNVSTKNIYFVNSIDLRYSGQAYEINIHILGDIVEISYENPEKDFHKAHEQLYWWNDYDRMIEIFS